MSDYYSDQLSAERLRRCYEVAPPRTRQYLEAEIQFVLERIKPQNRVLELGCGYGRVLARLCGKTQHVVGVDTSSASLMLARSELSRHTPCALARMNAVRLAFANRTFDAVLCIQNGISAFHVDPRDLIRETVRVVKCGGKLFFSSYTDGFWEERLHWFREQAAAGLLGEIDEEQTRNGVIACKDGFRAMTVGRDDFLRFTDGLNADVHIEEVDGSSLFCVMTVR